MHSSIANTRYGLHVQISEPKTSEPLPVTCRASAGEPFEIGDGRSGVPTFIMDTEGQFLRFVTNKSRVSDWNVIPFSTVKDTRDGSLHTNIDGEISNGWEEDLDVWTGDELGIHSSSVFKQSATQQRLRSKNPAASTVCSMNTSGKLLTFQTYRRRRGDTKRVLQRPLM